MPHKNVFHRPQTYIIPGFLILYFITACFYIRNIITDINLFTGLVVSAVIPFVLSIFLSIYLSIRTTIDLDEQAEKIKNDIISLPLLINRKTIICHGSKHSVPDGEKFWNDLLTAARYRFILIGRSNKSWISINEEQKHMLGNEIIRIVNAGGEIKIFSDNKQDHIEMTYTFFEKYVFPKIKSRGREVAKRTIRRFRARVVYCTGDVNYSAVVSDGRLLILPILHTNEFRDKTMVLEIDKRYNGQAHSDYNSDIDRTFHGKCNLLENKLNVFENEISA